MRVNPLPSHGMVTGGLRGKGAQPVTEANAVPVALYAPSVPTLFNQVTGKEGEGATHAHARAHELGTHPPVQPVTTRNHPVQAVSDESQAVTGNEPGGNQPVTERSTADLLLWINYAFHVRRSNPEIYFHLKNYPGLLSRARTVTDAACAGEDVDTLWSHVIPLQELVHRINAGTIPIHGDKPTVGRAKDRLNRNKATPRTTAPARTVKEVPAVRATAASTEVKKPARRAPRIDADTLMEQICQEYEHQEASGVDEQHLAFLGHALTCLAPALKWVEGDATTMQFPSAFQAERLAKTCEWLRGLASAPISQVEAARTQMLTALWQLWPAYCDLCSDTPLSEGAEYQERTWDFMNRVDNLWVDPAWGSSTKETAPYLPEFTDTDCGRVSYSFHLTLLALVTLNRQTGRALLTFQAEVN